MKIAFYSGVDEVAYIVFGAAGPSYNHTDWPVFSSATNITSWFDCTRILYSTFADQHLNSVPDFCSIHRYKNVLCSLLLISISYHCKSVPFMGVYGICRKAPNISLKFNQHFYSIKKTYSIDKR